MDVCVVCAEMLLQPLKRVHNKYIYFACMPSTTFNGFSRHIKIMHDANAQNEVGGGEISLFNITLGEI